MPSRAKCLIAGRMGDLQACARWLVCMMPCSAEHPKHTSRARLSRCKQRSEHMRMPYRMTQHCGLQCRKSHCGRLSLHRLQASQYYHLYQYTSCTRLCGSTLRHVQHIKPEHSAPCWCAHILPRNGLCFVRARRCRLLDLRPAELTNCEEAAGYWPAGPKCCAGRTELCTRRAACHATGMQECGCLRAMPTLARCCLCLTCIYAGRATGACDTCFAMRRCCKSGHLQHAGMSAAKHGRAYRSQARATSATIAAAQLRAVLHPLCATPAWVLCTSAGLMRRRESVGRLRLSRVGTCLCCRDALHHNRACTGPCPAEAAL